MTTVVSCLNDGEVNVLIAVYDRWKKEIIYRRTRTTFITTWSTTLFLAITGAMLTVDCPETTQCRAAAVLVVAAATVAFVYFVKNSRSHRRAAEALLKMESELKVGDHTLLAFYPNAATAEEAREQYYSEKGSAFQAVLVGVVAAACVAVLLLTGQ